MRSSGECFDTLAKNYIVISNYRMEKGNAFCLNMGNATCLQNHRFTNV